MNFYEEFYFLPKPYFNTYNIFADKDQKIETKYYIHFELFNFKLSYSLFPILSNIICNYEKFVYFSFNLLRLCFCANII